MKRRFRLLLAICLFSAFACPLAGCGGGGGGNGGSSNWDTMVWDTDTWG